MAELPAPPRIPLVATAFGAVSGIVTTFLLGPLTSRIPVPVVADFVKDLLKALLGVAVAVLIAFAASRVNRLDRFLNRHIGRAATLASLILTLTVWLRAGAPVTFAAIGSAALVAAETFLFLLFCAYEVQQSMRMIADSQQEFYLRRRESEAQDIAMEAISAGAPDAATAMFGLNLAGSFSGAVIQGCLFFVLTGFHFFAIWVVVTLCAWGLYGVSILWSVPTGFVMALAAMKMVSASTELGRRYADQIPLDDKYRSIRGEREAPPE